MSSGLGKSAVQQYKSLDVSTAVEAASPHRLIQMLMTRALQSISLARNMMGTEEIAAKGVHIGNAIDVINGLQASLNHKQDTAMAANFDELYGYMTRRLLEANLQNDKTILDEVDYLLREIKGAWDAIAGDDLAGVALEDREDSA